MNLQRFIVVALALTGLALAGKKGEFKKEMMISSPEAVKEGEKHFKKLCTSCHNDNGDGQGPAGKFLKPPPRSFLDPELEFKVGREPVQLYTTAVNGIPGTAMAPMGASLSEKERWEVVHYLGTFKGIEGKFTPITKENLDEAVKAYKEATAKKKKK